MGSTGKNVQAPYWLTPHHSPSTRQPDSHAHASSNRPRQQITARYPRPVWLGFCPIQRQQRPVATQQPRQRRTLQELTGRALSIGPCRQNPLSTLANQRELPKRGNSVPSSAEGKTPHQCDQQNARAARTRSRLTPLNECRAPN